jgi:signal transduction histidine kinase
LGRSRPTRHFPFLTGRFLAASLCITIVIVNSFLLRGFISYIGESFSQSFRRQNVSAIASADTFAITRQISSSLSDLPWVCVEGAKDGEFFLKSSKKTCESGFFTQWFSITKPETGGISLRVLLAPNTWWYTLFSALTLLELGFLFAYAKIVGTIEKRSAYEESALQTAQDLIARQNLEKELLISSSIARTTQALAHDVRKPFSMFKSIIQMVEAIPNPAQVKEVLNQTLPEVNQAMASVEGMIQDVMQIGSEAKLTLEDSSPATLLDVGFKNLFRVYPQVAVSITYKLFHTHQIKVDIAKVGRVIENILGNAIQAMGEKGEIWIHTTEQDGFVEFVMGNAGSVIPQENLSKLFDAFFTAGKKDGTGLGLAIAKKIVEAHNGKISCRSEISTKHPTGKVEFVFTLPIAEGLDQASEWKLPASSHEVQERSSRLRMAGTAVNPMSGSRTHHSRR